MVVDSESAEILDLEDQNSWPMDLHRILRKRHDALRSREIGSLRSDFDAAIYELMDALHCTRLAEHEVADILVSGMSLLSTQLIESRINAAVSHGLLTSDQGKSLRTRNQAAEPFRAGMLWFCFFPPAMAGEGGIGDLLSLWGGEAVYNSHDRDPETGPVLGRIGTAAIVEAQIPIGWLGDGGLSLALNVGRRFVVAQGTPSNEPVALEANVRQAIPSHFIRAVHLHPSEEFRTLTGCDGWYRTLA